MYEFFEHTADIGIRFHGDTLESALAEAGRAFSSLIVDHLDEVRPAESVRIECPRAEPSEDALDYLLFDWISALLREFESSHRVFSRFAVHVSPQMVTAECEGELLDPDRHRLGHEVKAVTYHQLELRQTADGFSGQVIVNV